MNQSYQQQRDDLAALRVRLVLAFLFALLLLGLLGLRLAWLQVVQHEHFADRAERNRTALVPVPPPRGQIYDRNGILLARNYSALTLEVTPGRVGRGLQEQIEALQQLIEITPRDLRRFERLRADSRRFEPLPLRTRLSDEEAAIFAANAYRFPGFEIRARQFRQYPMGQSAAHVIGYINRISERDIERLQAQDPAVLANYRGSTHIGREGIERSYEHWLHGRSGLDEVEITAGGRPVRTLSRIPPVPGHDLILSLDIGLQQHIEGLFEGRRGALVAIEPASGDILAFVSSPSFDPNLFVDGIDNDSWRSLMDDPDKPMVNRPLSGTYPVGSTYKPFMALAGLELGLRRADQEMFDPGFFIFGGHRFRDTSPVPKGNVDLHRSIVVSSDVYYYQLAAEMGVDRMHDFMQPLGFGQITGIDLEGERRGILPSTRWKREAFRRPQDQRWFGGDTISLGVGQGYNSFTLLQLAHATANLANQGVVMRPHLVRAIRDPETQEQTLLYPEPKHVIGWHPDNVRAVRRAMVDVNRQGGTAARSFAGFPFEVAGKTGTAQVFSLRGAEYRADEVDERLRDHSLYIAFAPAERPTIAIAVIVENGGFGSQAAAPMARRVFDYWLVERGMHDPEQAPPLQLVERP